MATDDKASLEQLYFDVPEINQDAAPVRIPHKIHRQSAGYDVFVHLLRLSSEFGQPDWAVAVEIVKGSSVVVPLTRLEGVLYPSLSDAEAAGMKLSTKLMATLSNKS